MIYYVANIALMIMLWILLEHCRRKYDLSTTKKTAIFASIVTIVWIILSGARAGTVGDDTAAYMMNFVQRGNDSWEELWGAFASKYIYKENITVKDAGYPLFVKTVHVITDNPQLYLVIVAGIFFIPMRNWIIQHSENALVSYIIFSCLFYSFFAITGIRQTIATSMMIFFGYDLIKKRKLLHFLALYAISSTIHASAIAFVPFYWIAQVKLTKYIILLYWLFIILSFTFAQKFLFILQSVVGYEAYQQYDGAALGNFAILYVILAVLYSIFYKKIVERKDNNAPLNAILTGCIFIPFLSINPSLMRVIQYYSIFLIILFPNAASMFSSPKDKQFYLYASCIILVLFLIKQNPYYAFYFI